MRLLKALIALLFVLAGVVFGALNRTPVHIDLWLRGFDTRLGLALLMVLLLGALLGGLAVTASVVWPLRRRLNKVSASTTGKIAALAPNQDSSAP
jgi:uncharacterized integral membrane protein